MSEEVIGGYRLMKHMATGQTRQVWEVVEVYQHPPFRHEVACCRKRRTNSDHRRFLFHEADVGIQLAHSEHHPHHHTWSQDDEPALRHGVLPFGQSQVRG